MKKPLLPALFLLFISLNAFAQKGPAEYVNPFIGTGGHGHTFPGAVAPFGLVQLSPDTRIEGWDACGGYYYDDDYVLGFSHTHLNGTGIADYSDILVMPTVGETRWNNGLKTKPGYGSHFSHSDEKAEAGYYMVKLLDYNIKAELTATTRAGMHCYTFPATDEANILFDLQHYDEVLESSLKVLSNTQIEGLRRSKSWADNQYVYFYAEFSEPFDDYDIAVNDIVKGAAISIEKQKNIKACFHFKTTAGQKIFVKVGLSSVSAESARKNLQSEMPGWDFNAYRKQAKENWNKQLSVIQVDGGSDDQKTIFYTALYHTMVTPTIYNDVDGNYRGRDLQVHNSKDFDYYTVFSLWDTYRALHPLMTIIEPKRTLDFIKTFLDIYDKGGLLPVWDLAANETFCMIGYHAVPVITDAYVKGIRNFDTKKALAAMNASAHRDNAGLNALAKNGYIASNDEAESVSKTLEYAYDDWCISQMAKELGNSEYYNYYIKRAQNYKNLFDPSTGFMRARTNGGWFTPFDPFEVNFNYTEANSWQYSFSATQDINGLAALHGGKDKLAAKLDQLFNASSKTSGRDQSDITGLIGQYAHGNEPSHHIAYLYPFVGQAYKTQELVHRILNTLYVNNADGLSGNEDCGQMSAWLVMSALGFYPVTPGTDYYVIGTPWFNKTTIQLENGKRFVINAKNISKTKFYIQEAALNGSKYTASFLKHDDIIRGGEITFTLSDIPNKAWGTGAKNEPVSAISDQVIVPVPAIENPIKSFKGSKDIKLMAAPETEAYYSIVTNGQATDFTLYKGPFKIDKTCSIQLYALQKKNKSQTITADFVGMTDDRDIKLLTQPASQYSSGGANNLIDGVRSSNDYKTGGWLGYEKINLEAVIDLRQPKNLTTFGAGFLQDIRSWIFTPKQIEFFISDNGTTYKSIGIIKNDVPLDKTDVFVKTYEMKVAPIKARYVKMVATNIGVCPKSHPGNGSPAWIFADEIMVK